jgi:hypothetical protein
MATGEEMHQMNKTAVAIMVGFNAVTQMIYGRFRLVR